MNKIEKHKEENMKKGFTLAEVLITLSIIAVIALLTVPSIIKNYKYKLYASTLKQTIAQLDDAIKSSIEDEHAPEFLKSIGGLSNNCTANNETGPCYIFEKYLKTKMKCAGSKDARCMSDKDYTTKNGKITLQMWNADRCDKLQNGATVCMVHNDNSSTTHVAIDVNGPDYPNIMGIDLFTGIVSPKGDIVDQDANPDHCNTETSSWNHVNDYTSGCLTKVIEDDWTIKE